MNVLFVSEYFWPRAAGGEVWAWEYCKELKRRGHNVTVFTLRHDASKKTETKNGVKIHREHRVGTSMLSRWRTARKLTRVVKKHLKKHRPDVIHVNAYAMNVPISRLAMKKNIPCVTSVHSYFGRVWRDISPFGSLMRILERRCIARDRATAIVVPSSYTKQLIESETGETVNVIHHWPPETFPKKKKLKDTWLFVGSLEPVKNPLACIPIAEKKKLVFIGDGSLRERIKRLKPDATILARLSRRETLSYLGGASLVLVPSLSESVPLVALEAAAQGTPVSGTLVGVLPELPGMVPFPPKTTPRRLTEKQIADVRKRFSKKTAVDAYLNIYKNIAI